MTTVADLIALLREMPQNLPVCLDDWNEDYRRPSNAEAGKVKLVPLGLFQEDGKHDWTRGPFVQIGDSRS